MSEPLSARDCPECGAPLPPDAPQGQCPRCLMAEILLPSSPSGTGNVRRPAVFSVDELAPHFPQYEILRLLGRGGMGAVYLARQTSLDRLVAIKILPADAGDEELNFAERFKNEARAMAKLSHPGIVAVHDFGETANGLLFIVMEYIEGTDVAQMVASQGRLHSAHAMAITAHVCDALQYAHARGIIHRDVKPSNIMVDSHGVVKVADFGLAKMSHGGQTAGLTQSGVTMGTLHFMAPEALLLGVAVDQRADIYAMGVMLYQMLTGKVPQGLFEMPSLQVPGLDPRYDGIVAKALREDRELRYQDAGEMRHDLDAILTQPVVKVDPPEEKKTPAALPPSQVKAQRPAGQPYRPPQPQVVVKYEKKTSPLLWIVLILLGGFAAWLYLDRPKRTQPTGTPPQGAPATVADPAPTPANGAVDLQPSTATKDQPFVNSLGMKFVPVPGTKVLFCTWETRFRDYEPFAKENPADADRKPPGWKGMVFDQAADYPVGAVRWSSARAFCEWLTKKERATRQLPDHASYRLPKESEWLRAAADELEHPTPDHPPGNFADESFHRKTPDLAWIRGFDDGFAATSPVGSFAGNRLGIHDLLGNVWEWCEEYYDSSVGGNRLLRGGACSEVGFGRHGTGDVVDGDVGFRVVLEVLHP